MCACIVAASPSGVFELRIQMAAGANLVMYFWKSGSEPADHSLKQLTGTLARFRIEDHQTFGEMHSPVEFFSCTHDSVDQTDRHATADRYGGPHVSPATSQYSRIA
jgi:hypothetical protein